MKQHHLKNLLPVSALAATMLFGACKKENDETPAVTEEEAVALIAEAVTDSASGLVVTVNTTADIASAYSAYCGVSKDSTVTRAWTGTVTSWSASLHWNWALVCNAGMPARFDFSAAGTADFNAPRIQSDDDFVAALHVTGNAPSEGSFTISAELERNGSQTSKVGNRNSFHSNLRYTADAIVVSKSTGQITSGAVTVSLTGESTRGRSFSYGGTLVFNGNRTGTLKLDNGGVYTISW